MLYVLITQLGNVSWSFFFKMATEVWAWKLEVDKNARFSMFDIVIYHNYR